MRHLIAIAALVLSAVPVMADHNDRPNRRPPGIRPPGHQQQYNANCRELERRTRGLDTAARVAPMSNYERQRVRQDAYEGGRYLNQAQYVHTKEDKDRICSTGNQAVDYSWRRWQPWLAQHGYDYPAPSEYFE